MYIYAMCTLMFPHNIKWKQEYVEVYIIKEIFKILKFLNLLFNVCNF